MGEIADELTKRKVIKYERVSRVWSHSDTAATQASNPKRSPPSQSPDLFITDAKNPASIITSPQCGLHRLAARWKLNRAPIKPNWTNALVRLPIALQLTVGRGVGRPQAGVDALSHGDGLGLNLRNVAIGGKRAGASSSSALCSKCL